MSYCQAQVPNPQVLKTQKGTGADTIISGATPSQAILISISASYMSVPMVQAVVSVFFLKHVKIIREGVFINDFPLIIYELVSPR